MFKIEKQKYKLNESNSFIGTSSYINSYRRNQQSFERNYRNSSIESKNTQLIKECSLINEEKLKLQKDLEKYDIENELLMEKNKKLNLVLEDKNNEIQKLYNILKEKDKIIYELKEQKNKELKNIYNLKENINNLDIIQNKNMIIINKLNQDKENLLRKIQEIEYEKEKMRNQIKLLRNNFGDMTQKLKEANNTIIKFKKNIEVKEQININNENEYKKEINILNKKLKDQDNIIYKLIQQIEKIIQRDKNIKMILLLDNNIKENNKIDNISEIKKLYNTLEQMY